MKRSEVNRAVRQAIAFFQKNGWALPPSPRWDVTDFGLGNFPRYGLVLINLAEEPEYTEKLLYATKGQETPAHCHAKKKEDIICRTGILLIRVWNGKPQESDNQPFDIKVNGSWKTVLSGDTIRLTAGERVTLVPGVYHEFYPESEECIIGEVSTANDDLNDNFFINPQIGRYSFIEEDEPPFVKLVSDK
ncbi:MAG: D-lyxose/D-mannose family sugar isomerase [Cytophagales bacterium]|nr:D-lyxose/D-mannose family sugar isomerase [Cytophagales bacterium]MDW8384768.1 D-lyxose/D-mannose family sugar isomerase [Flammeovirgaceae bacterium]